MRLLGRKFICGGRKVRKPGWTDWLPPWVMVSVSPTKLWHSSGPDSSSSSVCSSGSEGIYESSIWRSCSGLAAMGHSLTVVACGDGIFAWDLNYCWPSPMAPWKWSSDEVLMLSSALDCMPCLAVDLCNGTHLASVISYEKSESPTNKYVANSPWSLSLLLARFHLPRLLAKAVRDLTAG